MFKKLLFSTLVLFQGLSLVCQIDSHYWTNQYGAKGLLLNGAVIASADDETSIYYNPGCMGLDDNLGFAFSFLTPQYSTLRTSNFIGDNNLIVDNGLGFSPGFLAVRFRPTANKNFVIGVTSFERYKSNIKFEDRVINSVNATSLALFRADLKFQQKASEEWIGIGFAYNLSDKLGVGFTQFSVWRDESIDFAFKKEIVFSNNPQTVLLSWRSEFDYDLSIYSAFITKFGVNYRDENFSIGLTYTSPMYGRLKSGANYSLDDSRITETGGTATTISNRNEIDVQEYKSPFSVGIGFEFMLRKKVRLSLSGEFFNKTDELVYFQETDDSFNGTSEGNADVTVSVKAKRESVRNIAFGIQYLKNEKVTLIGGFRTDFNESSRLLINDTAEYLGSTPNVFHLSGGGTFKYKKNIFSIGIDLGYGKRSGGQQLADLTDINSDNLFTFSGNNNVSSQFFSTMLFITYDFIFNNF